MFHVAFQKDLEPRIVWQWHPQLDWKKILIWWWWWWCLQQWWQRKSPCHFWKWKHQRLFKTMFFSSPMDPTRLSIKCSFCDSHSQGNEISIRLVRTDRSNSSSLFQFTVGLNPKKVQFLGKPNYLAQRLTSNFFWIFFNWAASKGPEEWRNNFSLWANSATNRIHIWYVSCTIFSLLTPTIAIEKYLKIK